MTSVAVGTKACRRGVSLAICTNPLRPTLRRFDSKIEQIVVLPPTTSPASESAVRPGQVVQGAVAGEGEDFQESPSPAEGFATASVALQRIVELARDCPVMPSWEIPGAGRQVF
jgi:hypothetical protein